MDVNKLRELFEDNFEELKFEYGRSITPQMKEFAWQQVMLYYKKLRDDIAKKVTETEVKLILPDQTTPSGRKFTIEGIVDIVREEGKTTMYDIKTHKCDFVQSNKDLYTGQLNVYAHMWKNLRNYDIDEMAIIATSPSLELRNAIYLGDDDMIEELINSWNPIVELDFREEEVQKQIEDFSQTVDKIEDREFSAPPIAKLRKKVKGQKSAFGTAVCRHCDARHSCDSYYQYINKIDLGEDIDKEIEVETEEWKDSQL